jgi:hypothetical protein
MEAAFSLSHDPSGLAKMTLGFGEAYPPPAGHTDTRKKIIHRDVADSGGKVYVRSKSEALVHFVFLNVDTMLLWRHVLRGHMMTTGLEKIDATSMQVEKGVESNL